MTLVAGLRLIAERDVARALALADSVNYPGLGDQEWQLRPALIHWRRVSKLPRGLSVERNDALVGAEREGAAQKLAREGALNLVVTDAALNDTQRNCWLFGPPPVRSRWP